MIEEVFPPKTISPELDAPRSLATRKRRRRRNSKLNKIETEIRPLVSRKIRQQLFTKLSTNENFNEEISREKLKVCNSM